MAGFTPPPTQTTRLEGAPTWDLSYSSFGSFFASVFAWIAPRLVMSFDSEKSRIQAVKDDKLGPPEVWRIKGDPALWILTDESANEGAGAGVRIGQHPGTYAGAFNFNIPAGELFSKKLTVAFPAGRFRNTPGVAWSVQTRADDPEWSMRIEVRHVESTASNESMELYAKYYGPTGNPSSVNTNLTVRLTFVESEI